MEKKLCVLITNITLKARTGTETVVRDLSLGLREAGHYPMVYSPTLGDIACEIAAAGIPVVDNLRRVPREPDIIHGHHRFETIQALAHFSGACGIFVCHDRLSWHDAPPWYPRILRYVAVDLNCRERLSENRRIPDDRMRVIYNWADTKRFSIRSPLPVFPRRAVVFSNYAGTNTHLQPVQKACEELNIPLDVIGSGTGNSVARPEAIIGEYDLVFAKARCAIEAMASGAAVVLCDTRGLGSMVTSENIGELRPWNFGMRCLKFPLDPARIIQEIKRYYDPDDACAVSTYIRKHATLSQAIEQYVNLYYEVLSEHGQQRSAVFSRYFATPMKRLGYRCEKTYHMNNGPHIVNCCRLLVRRKLLFWV
jgi:hypothetical protein